MSNPFERESLRLGNEQRAADAIEAARLREIEYQQAADEAERSRAAALAEEKILMEHSAIEEALNIQGAMRELQHHLNQPLGLFNHWKLERGTWYSSGEYDVYSPSGDIEYEDFLSDEGTVRQAKKQIITTEYSGYLLSRMDDGFRSDLRRYLFVGWSREGLEFRCGFQTGTNRDPGEALRKHSHPIEFKSTKGVLEHRENRSFLTQARENFRGELASWAAKYIPDYPRK